MTKIEVSKAVRDAFPELRISYFTATQLRSQLRSANAEKLLDAAIADIQALNIQGEAIGQLPLLSPWRAAFARQGVKPAKFRPSAEALFRRFASGRYASVGNAIRPIAIGKKNWLFAGSARAGVRAAAIQTLLGTARMNGLDPYAWLTRVRQLAQWFHLHSPGEI